ncbi:Serine acetyltransferase 2 [Raphanus sativus]|nr:Serine acetyltransferase 2 [Raphanus sativus]
MDGDELPFEMGIAVYAKGTNKFEEEAKLEAEKEPILSSFLYADILAHECLEQALGFVLANRLQNPTLLATQLLDIFNGVMMHDKGIQRSIRHDIQAFKDRDPAL